MLFQVQSLAFQFRFVFFSPKVLSDANFLSNLRTDLAETLPTEGLVNCLSNLSPIPSIDSQENACPTQYLKAKNKNLDYKAGLCKVFNPLIASILVGQNR